MSLNTRTCARAGVVAALLAATASCGGGGDRTVSEAGGRVAVAAPDPAAPAGSGTAQLPASPPPSPPPSAPASVGDYKLVWQEEFNGSVIAAKCWDYYWNPFNNASELQNFVDSPENSFVKDGMLNIVALKKSTTVNGRTAAYTSAQLMTRSRGAWQYGRFEARIKIPKGNGLWPTFWLMPQDSAYGGWPASGEIDIAEWIGATPTRTYQSIHGPNTNTTLIADSGKNLGDDFHTYALEWTPTSMKYFVDGVETNEITKWNQPPESVFPAPFDQKFFIFLDLGVSSDWGGRPDAQTQFPATMLVDYVRVYQKGATASPAQCS
jgi:beta-glucanase (GH16 family)